MIFHSISTAPIDTRILLYWERSKHMEDGELHNDDHGKQYHVLFDGEQLNDHPSHWSPIPDGI